VRRYNNETMTRWLCASLFVLLPAAQSAVQHIYVVERSDVAGTRYERIIAKAHFALDPKLPANRIITDIDLAPQKRRWQGGVQRRPVCLEASQSR